jgi:hypothetical protein
MLSGAWRGQRGLQSHGLTAVLGAHGFQGCVSALPFSGEFLTVLTTQDSEFLTAGRVQFCMPCSPLAISLGR